MWHIAHCTGAHTRPNMRSGQLAAAPTAVNITCESNLSNGNSRLPLLISNYMYVSDLSWFGLVARGGLTGFPLYSYKMQSYRFLRYVRSAENKNSTNGNSLEFIFN